MFDFIKQLFKPKADFAQLVKHGAIIIDVRTKGEYATGHIRGSRNIPLDTMKKEVNSLKMHNKPVITVCRSGTRSSMAKSMLSSAGIEVYNGGAWNNLNKQL